MDNPSFCKLSVPTYRICEQFNDVILYQIDVSLVGITPWRIEKRYSDLFDLHTIFGAMFQHLPKFPGKTISKLKTNEQIEKRKIKLNSYLDSISKRLEIVTSELFNQFFEINKYASKYIFEPPQLVTSQHYKQTIKNCQYIPEQDLLLIVSIQNESYKQMMALVQNNENEVVHPLGFLEAISLRDNKIEKKWEKCYEFQVQCLHYSDSTLLVGLEKGKIVVYQMDAEFNQPIHQAHYNTHKSRVNGVYYDKLMKQIYSISSDGQFIVTQRDYLKHKDQMLLKSELTTMKVSDERCVAFIGTHKGLVYILDFSQNKVQCVRKMECQMRNKIVDMDINNQQGFLFVICEIGFLQVFDISKPGKEQNSKQKIGILTNESSKRIAYNKLRNHLYIADSLGFVSMLSEQTGTAIYQFMAHNFDCAITLLNYIDNKDYLISYGKDQELKIWQLPKHWINLSEVKYQAFQEIKNEQISKQKDNKNGNLNQFKDDDDDELHNWHR